MALLIDCYNVLHADARGGLTTGGLCERLGRSRWVRYGVTVVCDGRPKPDEFFDPPAGVEVVHSGPGRSADAVIVERIEGEANARRLVVVSNDRAIQRAARRRKANVWSSEQLLERLRGAGRGRSGSSGPAKPDPELQSPEQRDRWLRAFGFGEETGSSE